MYYLAETVSYLPCGLAASLLFLIIYELKLRAAKEKDAWHHRFMLLTLGIYLTIVFALTVSPIYGFSLSHIGSSVNLKPFQALKDISVNPMNFWGNIVLFIPFGLLLVLISKRCQKLHITLLAGAGLSLFIELLQLFGTRGTDIDDVILNTMGTLCGFIVGKILLGISPQLNNKAGVMADVGGRYYRKRRDSGGIAVLSLFVMASVIMSGFAIKAGVLKLPFLSSYVEQPQEQSLPAYAETPLSVNISARNALLWDLNSNTVLFDKEGKTQIAPASTTKMLTALTAMDYCSESDSVLVGEEVTRIAEDASRAWLSPGCEMTVRQLLDAMLLPSGNDAAYALAVFAGRKICGDWNATVEEALEAFVGAMNRKAASVGAKDSNFVNPDGYDADGQYTTAFDLACIARVFIKSDTLASIACSISISDVWQSGQAVTYNNTNELLNPESPYYYECAAGLKTGKSEKAGCCLVSSAEIGGKTYICVVMGSTEEGRWKDSLALYGAVQS
ncbi:MAG: VanZ family protein [Oscillospiraceae bacterium]